MSHVLSPVPHVSRLMSHVLPLALPLALALSAAFIASAAESVNAGGLLRIDSKATNTVVNVPWVGFDANGSKPIDVARLVKTRNLVPGDTVMAAKADGVYEAWTVGAGGAWEPVTTVAKGPGKQTLAAAGAAAERTLSRGLGLWLVRCGEGADVTKPFYVSGQLAAGAATTTIAKGAASAPAWTLLANPDRTAATDLNAIDWQAKPLAADQVTVAVAGRTPVIYTWKGGKWGTGGGYALDEATGLMKQRPRVETAIAPAGAAIWYVRRGAAFSIQW